MKILKIPNFLKNIFLPKNRIESITYYIPGPASRKTGFREKQFDMVFSEFINKGYKILDIKTESHQSEHQSGMWVLILTKAPRGVDYKEENTPLEIKELIL